MWLIAVSGFTATVGFGVLFNIKGKKLYLAGIGGMLGGVIYSLCKMNECPEALSLFYAGVGFALYSEIFARICRTPVTTFIICALIPLVPGKGMYETMRYAVAGDAQTALQTGLDTLIYAGALALGIILVSTLMRFLCHHPKPSKTI